MRSLLQNRSFLIACFVDFLLFWLLVHTISFWFYQSSYFFILSKMPNFVAVVVGIQGLIKQQNVKLRSKCSIKCGIATSQKNVRVGVLGASGYTGSEVSYILYCMDLQLVNWRQFPLPMKHLIHQTRHWYIDTSDNFKNHMTCRVVDTIDSLRKYKWLNITTRASVGY